MPNASNSGVGFRTKAGKPGNAPLLSWALGLIATFIASASAQGLYGPEAPADVAYLRLINASGDAVTMSVDGSEWQPLRFAEVSNYRPLEPGEHRVELAGREIVVSAAPEAFLTVVALKERALLLEDTPLRDISRGMLTLYNLTGDGALSLRTDQGAEVLTAVPPESAASVAISEAEVGLEVHRNGKRLAALETRLYTRGEAHAVIVLPTGSQPSLVYARAAAEP